MIPQRGFRKTRGAPWVIGLLFWGITSAALAQDQLEPGKHSKHHEPTVQPSVSPTTLPTATPTPSMTPTSGPTPVPTATPTGTLTPPMTDTPTDTPTPTSTITPTKTPTTTPTPTSTPGIFQFKISPRPVQGLIHFQWGTTMQVQEVNLSVYTSSFRIIRRFTFSPLNQVEYLAVGVHEFVWDGQDEEGRPLVPGTYLCFIGAKLGKINYESSGDFSTP